MNYHPPPLPSLARTVTVIMTSSQTFRLVLFLVMLVKLPYCLNHLYLLKLDFEYIISTMSLNSERHRFMNVTEEN